MSLILEALKKSEQQRKLGQAPTLGSPVLAARRPRRMLPVLAALIAIAAGAGWWLLREPTPSAPVASAPAAKDSAAPTPSKTAVPANPGPANGPTAGHMSSRNPSISVAQQGRLLRQTTAAQQHAGTTPTAADKAAPTPVPTPGAPRAAGGAGAANTALTAAPRKRVNEDRPVTPTPLPAAPVAQPPPAKAAPTIAAKPQQPAVPSIFELPYAKRKDIPSIDLSMHVYSSDPGSRFVVIKGDRHVEGDDLGDGLTLKEIRADGIVLDFKGSVFAFPRDGGH